MVNWQNELKRYIAKRMKIKMDVDISPTAIADFNINDVSDLTKEETKDLSIIYAFALMSEDFEKANEIKIEIESRNCSIKIIPNDNNTSIIKVYDNKVPSIFFYDIHMKITKDGMIMDFEKQNF